MCRSAVESLLFTVVYSNFNANCCEIKFDPPKLARFDKVKECAKNKGYLNGEHLKWLLGSSTPNDPEVGIIRYSGDLVAHYTEKIINNQHPTKEDISPQGKLISKIAFYSTFLMGTQMFIVQTKS